jgi:hypothetical protein
MKDLVQIKIGKHMTGIVGLKSALEEVKATDHGLGDDDIAGLLVKNLSQKNYIPSNVTDLYEAALLREYKNHIGEKTEDEPLEGIEIKVLGVGCPTCDHLVQELMAVIEETGIEAGLEHVRDQQEISRYVVMGLPAIVINGKVVDAGPNKSRARLKELLSKGGTQA